MKAEIFKINSNQPNVKETFKQICQKYDCTASEITVIVKPQSSSVAHLTQLSLLNNNKKTTQNRIKQSQREHDPAVAPQMSETQSTYSRNNRLLSECFNRKAQNISGNMEQIEANFNVIISTNNILPNVIVTEKTQRSKLKDRKRKRNSLQISCRQQLKSLQISSKSKISQSQVSQNNSIPNQIPSLKILQSSPANFDKSTSEHHVQTPTLNQPPSKIVESDSSQSENNNDSINMESENESIVQSLFIIEDKLNDAIQFIKKNKLFELEEYLYEFKIKYKNMSDRVQVKWRLIMAHCKENRKQYERASILYQQVLEMAEAKPKLLFVDQADIHHRLGICYTQIRRWNNGIQCFANALKQYRKNDKKLKYAECLNNLGSLYLTAYKIQQAEQCFLQSYEIKKNELGQNSRKLVSCILNLFECNILIHNYEQAQALLRQFQSVIMTLKDAQMLKAGLYRRKGKLSFLMGDLQSAQQQYQKGLDILTNRYPFSLEYGQLCHNLAIIKLQKKQAEEARQLLNISMSRLSFYYTKDSAAILNIKSNLQLVEKLQFKPKAKAKNNVSRFNDKVKQF